MSSLTCSILKEAFKISTFIAKFSKYVLTVEPRFFEHVITRIPQFFELFSWSLGFALRNPYKLPGFFELQFFKFPDFSNHICGPFD